MPKHPSCCLAFPFALAFAATADAATYVVDNTSADAGVSACNDATANDCSLAGAVAKANASTGVVDTIHFNIPTSDPGCHATQGWCVIAGSGDVTVNEALTIDGFTQPGASANTIAANVGGLNAIHKIQINPALKFTAPGTVRGLVLNGRGNNQVYPLKYSNPNATTTEFLIEGNAFGEALDGGISMVTWAFVLESRQPVRVGGLQPAQRNLFCKAGAAIVNHTNTGKVKAYGNLFGVNADGNTMTGCGPAEAIDGNWPYYDDDYTYFGSNDPNGRNIVDDGSCISDSPNDQRNTDAKLGGFDLNGGIGATFMPLADSPALDYAQDCPATDQRGYPRPLGAGCDVGAIERGALVFLPLTRR